MQFVANGPDIPDALLQAHEEGRVVFFCGAGISYPAGLPGFGGLVESIYRIAGTTRSRIEEEAFTHGRFDATLDLLERRLPGQRLAVRRYLAQALKPKLRRKGATATHEALLTLARTRNGALRLVTTNFDRLFEKAAKRTKVTVHAYPAPLLPIPKNSRWDGVVYLHGFLPEKPDDSALNRLVVTSGDFGLAYLTERWAARFVSELFRNYVVCFVGYSINDPVLRYMMDALAADRMLGETTPQAWALGDYEPGSEASKSTEWEAKGVSPILYEAGAGKNRHSVLHTTLQEWADTYRDGVTGKERIVVNHALARPSASTRQDDYVGRMLWALADASGLPARLFADFNPVPSLDWLFEAFADGRYRHADLNRFGVPPREDVDAKLRFSLIHRPAPYLLAPPMTLVSGGTAATGWDDVMYQLARWLMRHLNDPRVVIWIAQHGGQLHHRWAWSIEDELERLAKLVVEGKTIELAEIRSHAPNAIPGPLMRHLWRLLLSGRVKSSWHKPDLYRWKARFKREEWSSALRIEMRELLAPRVALKPPFRLEQDSVTADEPTHMRQLVDWDLVLASDHVRAALKDLAGDLWNAALPRLLSDFEQLVCDCLDLMRELGEASDRSDRSHWDLPSISTHPQNRGFQDWVTLIELLRDSWLATAEIDPRAAASAASRWYGMPYPTFKRLAFYAASREGTVDSGTWIGWLLADRALWLWSSETHREVCRLLVQQGSALSEGEKEQLESAILIGPPREMYRADLEPERWSDIGARAVWLRLSKLRESGLMLGREASSRLNDISDSHPYWQLAPNQRDEFTHWMSGTGDADFEDSRERAPRGRSELAKWLQLPRSDQGPFDEDNWREVCRSHFYRSWSALSDVADKGVWPTHRWETALLAWSEDGKALRAWRHAAPLVERMPDSVLLELAHEVSWWIEAASKSIDRHEEILLELSRRMLAMPLEGDTGIRENGAPLSDPVNEAINHPIGHVTQALFNLWFKRQPSDGDLIPEDLEPIFTQICNVDVDRFRHGRVLLAARVIALFRVDRRWTEQNLLPLFDWDRTDGAARSVWHGFLWSPRLYRPLLVALKRPFIQTAYHYAELGDKASQYAAFLTFIALESVEGFSRDDYRVAIGALPPSGLEECARALVQALTGAGAQSAEYWVNRVVPFWREVWPQSRELRSPEITESLAELCIVAGNAFPPAFALVADWLLPVEHPHYLVNRLFESGLCTQFPFDALQLLDRLIEEQSFPPLDLGRSLEQIVLADPKLSRNARFQRLSEYSRRRGG